MNAADRMNKLGAEYETCGCMTAKDLVHADALRRAPDRTPGQTYVRIHVLVYTINVVHCCCTTLSADLTRF